MLVKLLEFLIPMKSNRQLQNLICWFFFFFIFRKLASINSEFLEDFFCCFITLKELLSFISVWFDRYKCKVKEQILM